MSSRHFLTAFLLSLAALAGELRAVTPPAAIAYVEGKVLLLRRGEQKPVDAELGMSLFYGDQIRTVNGKCQINMTASGILRLSPNTTVYFPTEENTDDKITVMRMLMGKTEQNLRNLWKDEVFEVRPPSLVLGVQDGGELPPNRPIDDYPPPPRETPGAKPAGADREPAGANQEIERLRAEGNAKLDAIRAELKNLEGKAISHPCGTCGKKGPHRWTSDGWECNCGATAVSFGNYPTSQGAYNAVRDDYKARIERLGQ